MTHNRNFAYAIFFLLFPLGACGDSNSNSHDAGVSPSDGMTDAIIEYTDGSVQPSSKKAYLDHIEQLLQAKCDRAQRCDSPQPEETVAECVARREVESHPKVDRIADSIAAQGTAYDSMAAASCLATYTGDCTITATQQNAACAPVIEGTLPVGSACVGHFECGEPVGHQGMGPYCFEECTGLWGNEDPIGNGICVAKSPISTGEC
jgi:hypothetical protein